MNVMEQLVASAVNSVGLSIDSSSLMSVLNDLGVEKPSDIAFLHEGDLTGVCKIVEARKLIAHLRSAADPTGDPQESADVCTSASSVVIARPACVVTSPCGRLPSPYRFPLHSISESLQATINNGDHLQTGQRSQLLDAMYQDVTDKVYTVSWLFTILYCDIDLVICMHECM